MKDHIIAAVVNDLRDTAIKFHNTQQLRERLRGCIEPLLDAAAPQVVADERRPTLAESGALRQYLHNDSTDANENFVFAYDKDITDRYIAELRAAAPVQAQEPANENEWLVANLMKALQPIRDFAADRGNPYQTGIAPLDWEAFAEAANRMVRDYKPCTMVQAQEPVWTKEMVKEVHANAAILASKIKPGKISDPDFAPVQPVAVPDGWKLVPIVATPEMLEKNNYKHEVPCGYENVGIDDSILPEIWASMVADAPAAPAAQGDAIRKVEVDNQGPLGIVTKTTYALANSKDAEAAAFYRYLRDEVIGDDPEAIGMDKAKKPGLDAACRAAIAAKAAS